MGDQLAAMRPEASLCTEFWDLPTMQLEKLSPALPLLIRGIDFSAIEPTVPRSVSVHKSLTTPHAASLLRPWFELLARELLARSSSTGTITMQLTSANRTFRRKISPTGMTVDAIVHSCMQQLDGVFTRVGLTFEPKKMEKMDSVQKYFVAKSSHVETALNGAAASDQPGWRCDECGRIIEEALVGEHLDEHIARRLQREWNSAGTRSDASDRPENGLKHALKRPRVDGQASKKISKKGSTGKSNSSILSFFAKIPQ